jgi:plasmid replication initiation protein
MYSLLKQYERLNGREINLEKLRNILGLKNDQYTLYSNFKKDILESTQKELNSKSDLTFEFDEIKHGRKVGAIRFRIISKRLLKNTSEKPLDNVIPITTGLPQPEPQINPLLAELLILVPKQHQAKKSVEAALKTFEKKHGFDYVKRNILYSNAKAAKSYAGFLNNALKEDWGHDWELEQQEVSVNKKGKEAWERNGFNSQKEYDDFMYKKQMEAYGKKA